MEGKFSFLFFTDFIPLIGICMLTLSISVNNVNEEECDSHGLGNFSSLLCNLFSFTILYNHYSLYF